MIKTVEVVVIKSESMGAEESESYMNPSVNEIRTDIMNAAVVIRNAELHYRNGDTTLTGLDMTVPSGSIYMILGSSGCGKTSLLSCITGIRKLSNGSLWVFGKKYEKKSLECPGKTVGYMPQDLSLHLELSIRETLTFYGKLGGLATRQIDARVEVLKKLFELPSTERRIAMLSGGQQRSVSMASSMIHKPQLLILDEPTVGMDPLLRERIVANNLGYGLVHGTLRYNQYSYRYHHLKVWEYLCKLTKCDGTTVIITTHYIEEARHANMVGIIQHGKLITENSPQQIIANHSEGSGLLETAILKLWKQIGVPNSEITHSSVICLDMQGIKSDENGENINFVPKNRCKESINRITALTRQNLIIWIKNIWLLIFVVCVPAIEVLFVCITFGFEPANLQLGVINHEINITFCHNIQQTDSECDLTYLSCGYLKYIPKARVHTVAFSNEQDAKGAVQKGTVWGYLIFQKNFSSSIYDGAIFGTSVDEITINYSQIIGKLDQSNKLVSTSIKLLLLQAFSDFTSNLLSKCGFDPRQSQSPLLYGSPIYGKDDRDPRGYSSCGMAIASLFFFPIITTGICIVNGRNSGLHERLQIAGVRMWEIIAAYIVSESFVIVVQALLVFSVLTAMSDFTIGNSAFLVFALFILSGYCGISLGFLFGIMCRENNEVAILALTSLLPNLLLCGIFWPVEGLPPFLQYAVKFLPCTLPAESIRSIISRGWGLSQNIWPGFCIPAAHTVLYAILSISVHYFRS